MNDTSTLEAPERTSGPTDRERSDAIAIFAFVFAAIGVLTSLFAVGLAVRAVQRADKAPAASSTGGGGAVAEVDLSEFKIAPNPLDVKAGSTLTIVNKGTTAHDLQVGDIKSKTVDAGSSTNLDISKLAPGSYDMWCTVPGHKDAGMTGKLEVS